MILLCYFFYFGIPIMNPLVLRLITLLWFSQPFARTD